MSLTRSYKETVAARIARDAAFRDALLTEAVRCLRAGDVDTGKAIIRDCTSRNAPKPAHAAPRRRQGR